MNMAITMTPIYTFMTLVLPNDCVLHKKPNKAARAAPIAPSILKPQKGTLQKLSTYIPLNALERVRQSLFDVGAGNVGNYDQCSFVNEGMGSFRGNDQSHPTLGEKNQWHQENEANLHLTFPKHLQSVVLSTLFEHHPYEEVAYELSTLENSFQKIGMGMIGELPQPLSETEFFSFVKKHMNTPLIRHSQLLGKSIQKVAVLGVFFD